MTPLSSVYCVSCNQAVRDAIYDSQFYPNLLLMVTPFITLTVVILILTALSMNRHRTLVRKTSNILVLNPVPVTAAALVLGIGMGGFLDGIVLHQLLQWHNMLSHQIPPIDTVSKSVNMFWDGIFHAFCFLAILLGIVLLYKTMCRDMVDKSPRLVTGGLLAGWGLFNVIEGVFDHHILRLHMVRENTEQQGLWNYGFLAISVLLLILGFAATRRRVAIGKEPAYNQDVTRGTEL